jgi:hypothetical protein
MEGYIEEQIFVRQQVSLLGLNSKEFSTKHRVPIEFRSNISKIGKLNGLGDLRVDDNGSKAHRILHQLHLDAMGCAENVEQLLLLLILNNFIVDSSLEGIDPGSRFETELDVLLLSGVYCDRTAWNNLQELFFQLFHLTINIECNLNLLL